MMATSRHLKSININRAHPFFNGPVQNTGFWTVVDKKRSVLDTLLDAPISCNAILNIYNTITS